MRYLKMLVLVLPWWAFFPIAGGFAYLGEQAYQGIQQSQAVSQQAVATEANPAVADATGNNQGSDLALDGATEYLRWSIWGFAALIALFGLGKRHFQRRRPAVSEAEMAHAATNVESNAPFKTDSTEIYSPPRNIYMDDEDEDEEDVRDDAQDQEEIYSPPGSVYVDDESEDDQEAVYSPPQAAHTDGDQGDYPAPDDHAVADQAVLPSRRLMRVLRIAACLAIATSAVLFLPSVPEDGTPPSGLTSVTPKPPNPPVQFSGATEYAVAASPRPMPRPYNGPAATVLEQIAAAFGPAPAQQPDPIILPNALVTAPLAGPMTVAALYSVPAESTVIVQATGPVSSKLSALSVLYISDLTPAPDDDMQAAIVSPPAVRSATDAVGSVTLAALPVAPGLETAFVPPSGPPARNAAATELAGPVAPTPSPHPDLVVPAVQATGLVSADAILADVPVAPVDPTPSPHPDIVVAVAAAPAAPTPEVIVASAPVLRDAAPEPAIADEPDLVTRGETSAALLISEFVADPVNTLLAPENARTRFLMMIAAAVLALLTFGAAIAMLLFIRARAASGDAARVDRVMLDEVEEERWAKLSRDAHAATLTGREPPQSQRLVPQASGI